MIYCTFCHILMFSNVFVCIIDCNFVYFWLCSIWLIVFVSYPIWLVVFSDFSNIMSSICDVFNMIWGFYNMILLQLVFSDIINVCLFIFFPIQFNECLEFSNKICIFCVFKTDLLYISSFPIRFVICLAATVSFEYPIHSLCKF